VEAWPDGRGAAAESTIVMPDEADDDVLSDGTPARHYRRRSEEL
jgi:hypothetical protein